MSETTEPKVKVLPGACIPWEQIRKEMPAIQGDEALVRRVWEEVDGLGYVFIWQCLLSF